MHFRVILYVFFPLTQKPGASEQNGFKDLHRRMHRIKIQKVPFCMKLKQIVTQMTVIIYNKPQYEYGKDIYLSL